MLLTNLPIKTLKMELLVMCAVIPVSFGLALLLQLGALKIILRALHFRS
jgi:hypothetical protein